MAKKKDPKAGIPDVTDVAEKPVKKAAKAKKVNKVSGLSEKETASLERELRRYVRFKGGLVKDLTEAQKERCKVVMEKLGRTELEWDTTIEIYDRRAMMQDHNKPIGG
jgi:hypothetical protein